MCIINTFRDIIILFSIPFIRTHCILKGEYSLCDGKIHIAVITPLLNFTCLFPVALQLSSLEPDLKRIFARPPWFILEFKKSTLTKITYFSDIYCSNSLTESWFVLLVLLPFPKIACPPCCYYWLRRSVSIVLEWTPVALTLDQVSWTLAYLLKSENTDTHR
jgi:hypothetical protein